MDEPNTSRYTNGDMLGAAFACLAIIVAIILFLLSKTRWSVFFCLFLIFSFGVHPVLHFSRKRLWRVVVGFVVLVGIVVAIGTSALPPRIVLPPTCNVEGVEPEFKEAYCQHPELGRPKSVIKGTSLYEAEFEKAKIFWTRDQNFMFVLLAANHRLLTRPEIAWKLDVPEWNDDKYLRKTFAADGHPVPDDVAPPWEGFAYRWLHPEKFGRPEETLTRWLDLVGWRDKCQCVSGVNELKDSKFKLQTFDHGEIVAPLHYAFGAMPGMIVTLIHDDEQDGVWYETPDPNGHAPRCIYRSQDHAYDKQCQSKPPVW